MRNSMRRSAPASVKQAVCCNDLGHVRGRWVFHDRVKFLDRLDAMGAREQTGPSAYSRLALRCGSREIGNGGFPMRTAIRFALAAAILTGVGTAANALGTHNEDVARAPVVAPASFRKSLREVPSLVLVVPVPGVSFISSPFFGRCFFCAAFVFRRLVCLLARSLAMSFVRPKLSAYLALLSLTNCAVGVDAAGPPRWPAGSRSLRRKCPKSR